MSGFSVALNKRNQCEASGKDYKRFLRSFNRPGEDGRLSCPMCGKGVTLRPKSDTGELVVIPRHLELIVGL